MLKITATQPTYTDCSNCGTCDHNGYACPCECHKRARATTAPKPTTIRTVTRDRAIVTTPVADILDDAALTREQRRELVRTGAAEWRTNASAPPAGQGSLEPWDAPDVFVRIPVAERLS